MSNRRNCVEVAYHAIACMYDEMVVKPAKIVSPIIVEGAGITTTNLEDFSNDKYKTKLSHETKEPVVESVIKPNQVAIELLIWSTKIHGDVLISYGDYKTLVTAEIIITIQEAMSKYDIEDDGLLDKLTMIFSNWFNINSAFDSFKKPLFEITIDGVQRYVLPNGNELINGEEIDVELISSDSIVTHIMELLDS